uniref:Uncharacterized protein n=1 Tax=Amphimedon queenslandica TaxID=400682 RepID=A0A1X7UYN4_AMPQE
MVLATTTEESDDLETIAPLADMIAEVEHIRSQISDLQTLVQSLQCSKSRPRDSQQHSASPTPAFLCNRFGYPE